MLLKRALIIFLALVLLVATGWGALVLLYAGPATAVWASASLATVYAVGSLAALAWLRPLWRALAIWGVGLFAILIWWSTLRPSNDGDWQQDGTVNLPFGPMTKADEPVKMVTGTG